ncbi:MAG TPA: FAD-binding oxidoreductase [Xanthomonadaceae bacterium]|nr:FAD-binding oxidoreductase [Xanthomonadaceae bacterium]
MRERLQGELLLRGDPGYDPARTLWNARLDRHPALIARCHDADDVVTALAFASEHALPLSVKGGGHDFAGNSVRDGGLTLDLSPMDAVRVDAQARIAQVGPGARWADVDHATQAVGLATPGATVSTVGVPGFVLSGGIGHLARRHGAACDNLVGADVVLASGEKVRATAAENPELLWALRGGGGNFGVVTSFELQLHPVGPEVCAGQLVYRYEDAAAALRHYRDFMATAPDAVQCWAFLLRLPPLPAFPEALHGQPALDFVVCHAGSPAEAEADLAPLRAFGTPVIDAISAVPYVALQQAFDAGMPHGRRWYSRAHYLRALPDAAIDTLLQHAQRLPGESTTVYLGAEGGAIGRVERDATAFPHRDAAFSLHVFPGWCDAGDDADIMRWAREVHRAMAPYATGGVYANMLADDEQDRVGAAYAGNYERLANAKRRWDPRNLFAGNHNVVPSD